MQEGMVLWNCYACNNNSNCGFADSNYTIIIDTTAPVVSLVAPVNNTLESSSSIVTFMYNVTDVSTIANCSLYIDNTLNQTDTTITKDTNQTFTQFLANGNYNWSVKCFDSVGLEGANEVYNLSINYSGTNWHISTEADLDLKPGEHTLCLQAADGAHTALSGEGTTQVVTLSVH